MEETDRRVVASAGPDSAEAVPVLKPEVVEELLARLAKGEPVKRLATAGGAAHGVGDAAAAAGDAPPLGPWQSIRGRGVPGAVGRPRHRAEYERGRQLLRQCGGGELLLDGGVRGAPAPALGDPGGGPGGRGAVYRAVVQSAPPAFYLGVSQSDGVRSAGPSGRVARLSPVSIKLGAAHPPNALCRCGRLLHAANLADLGVVSTREQSQLLGFPTAEGLRRMRWKVAKAAARNSRLAAFVAAHARLSRARAPQSAGHVRPLTVGELQRLRQAGRERSPPIEGWCRRFEHCRVSRVG